MNNKDLSSDEVKLLLAWYAEDVMRTVEQEVKDVEEESGKNKGPSTVNNALFVGSTAELSKLLKNGLKDLDK